MTAHRSYRDFADLQQLLGGSEQNSSKQVIPDGKGRTIEVSVDSKGRKGKTVTVISGIQHNLRTLDEIAKALKQFCGAGGTVKKGRIEIQGDQRKRVAEKLSAMNYKVSLR